MPKIKEIDGVTYEMTHSGQRQAYGDSFYDYVVISDLPATDVERVCREKVSPAKWSVDQWRQANREKPSAANYFTPHYTFRPAGPKTYIYSVCMPYTD